MFSCTEAVVKRSAGLAGASIDGKVWNTRSASNSGTPAGSSLARWISAIEACSAPVSRAFSRPAASSHASRAVRGAHFSRRGRAAANMPKVRPCSSMQSPRPLSVTPTTTSSVSL